VFAQSAARLHVAVTPGSLFAVDEACNEFLRLPFLLDEPQLRLGVRRMAEAWRQCRKFRLRTFQSRPIV
jgi:hypothetical protein